MSCQYKTDIAIVQPGRPTANAVVHYSLRAGRDSAQFRCWWDKRKYVACQAAKLEAENGCVYYLVWPRSFDASIDLVWSVKNSTVNFTKIKGVKHLALFCSDKLTCLRHWTAGKLPNQPPTLVTLIDTCPDGCMPGNPDSGGEDPCLNPPELKFNPGPLLTGTGKPGRTLTGEFGEATGGVTPYKPYIGKFRYRPSDSKDPWIDLTDWSEENPQTFEVTEDHVGQKINFYQQIEDSCGQIKATGSSKDIIDDPNVKTCKPIQDLPRIDTGDPPAERSTLLFDICVDINALPSL